MIKIKNLHKSFGELEVLRGIDLEIDKGEVISIIGPSGTGKSTLLRCINFLDNPTSGIISIDNLEVDSNNCTKEEIYRLRKETAMVFQTFNLFNNKTVMENITEALIVVGGKAKKEAEKKGEEILQKVGLLDKKDFYPSKLSGGQKQRVGIGRAIALEPKVILLDEPTSALDPELVSDILKLIKDLANGEMTMLIVTHEMQFARDISDRIVFLDKGRVEEIGSPDEIFNNSKNKRVREFLNKVITH